MVSGVGRNSSGHLNWNWRFLARGTIMMEKIWWNNFWYLYPDINFVIDCLSLKKVVLPQFS